jgi:hypothetical protein
VREPVPPLTDGGVGAGAGAAGVQAVSDPAAGGWRGQGAAGAGARDPVHAAPRVPAAPGASPIVVASCGSATPPLKTEMHGFLRAAGQQHYWSNYIRISSIKALFEEICTLLSIPQMKIAYLWVHGP